jgi:hypothetical protein
MAMGKQRIWNIYYEQYIKNFGTIFSGLELRDRAAAHANEMTK